VFGVFGLANLCEEQVITDLLAQSGAEVLMDRLLEFWIVGKQSQRVFPGLLEQFHFVGDVGKFELGETVLAGTEEFAGAPEGEVHLGDFEAVVCAGH